MIEGWDDAVFADDEFTPSARLLVKPTKSAASLMPQATYEQSYPGAREMLLVDNVDDKAFLANLFRAMHRCHAAART